MGRMVLNVTGATATPGFNGPVARQHLGSPVDLHSPGDRFVGELFDETALEPLSLDVLLPTVDVEPPRDWLPDPPLSVRFPTTVPGPLPPPDGVPADELPTDEEEPALTPGAMVVEFG